MPFRKCQMRYCISFKTKMLLCFFLLLLLLLLLCDESAAFWISSTASPTKGIAFIINERKAASSSSFDATVRPTSALYVSSSEKKNDEEISTTTTSSSSSMENQQMIEKDIMADFSSMERDDYYFPQENYFVLNNPSEIEIRPPPAEEKVVGYQNPVAAMLQNSAPYIASHSGELVVCHIPGSFLDHDELFNTFIEDIALSWLLGLKIVLVASPRVIHANNDNNNNNNNNDNNKKTAYYAAKLQNTLHKTDLKQLRLIEEEIGYIRFELERKLHRYLKLHAGITMENENLAGNVVSGPNFYTARPFGTIRGQDFQFTGYTSCVFDDTISNILDKNGIVLLTTLGTGDSGDLISVNGYHLAAKIAIALKAHKLIYMADQASVLTRSIDQAQVKGLPLTFCKNVTAHFGVKVVASAGFALLEDDVTTQNLPCAVELLLHLAWASWALEDGAVTRAHIVNPKDGSLLEELFTSSNGANTCLYHDREHDHHEEGDDDFEGEDWDDFFSGR